MRRPVKPFVTEYRGSGRRAKDGRPEERPKGNGGASNGRGSDAPRDNLAPRDLFRTAPEMAATDGYEAAMRAADALFSPRSASAAPAGAAGHAAASVTGEDAVPASDPRPNGQHPASLHDAGESVGRVLRALDEPEAEPPEVLADEPAPKRRGRKPGSSNKPKLPPAIHRRKGGPTASADGDAGATSAAALLTAAAPQAEATDDLRQDEAAPTEEPRSAVPVGRGTPSVTARRREPFAWVRTKLRPGEKWKRRLPKVAW